MLYLELSQLYSSNYECDAFMEAKMFPSIFFNNSWLNSLFAFCFFLHVISLAKIWKVCTAHNSSQRHIAKRCKFHVNNLKDVQDEKCFQEVFEVQQEFKLFREAMIS